jgi:signal transduction histidine kinase
LWTLERISWALGFLAVFALAAVTWIALLRRRVANQTRIIAEQIERAAVNEERQRIARELHDTLEQDLAGTSAQLRNARRRLDAEPARAGDAIDLAERMLDHCREEARTSIRDLRSVTLEQRGLRGALEEFLAPLAAESSVRFRIEVEGQPYSLPGPTGIHLLRIAHQAVVNAIQHGHSREIVVRLAYEEELVRLEIRDDGTGFDPGESARRGRFGILGMRERANKLQAELEIESAPGAGSCIRIVVPLREVATVNACQP